MISRIQMNRSSTSSVACSACPIGPLSHGPSRRSRNAVNYIGAFEKTLAGEARRHGADGVICGHIHYASFRDDQGIRYMNCGDWVESCTALVEHEDANSRSSPGPIRSGGRLWCRGLPRAQRETHAHPGRDDAWHPQVNGVVRTLTTERRSPPAPAGAEVSFLTPESFRILRDAELSRSAPGAAAPRKVAA